MLRDAECHVRRLRTLITRHRKAMFADAGSAPERGSGRDEYATSSRGCGACLTSGKYAGWIISDGDRAIASAGFLVLDWAPHYLDPTGEQRGYVLNVWVEPKYRRRGLAQSADGRMPGRGPTSRRFAWWRCTHRQRASRSTRSSDSRQATKCCSSRFSGIAGVPPHDPRRTVLFLASSRQSSRRYSVAAALVLCRLRIRAEGSRHRDGSLRCVARMPACDKASQARSPSPPSSPVRRTRCAADRCAPMLRTARSYLDRVLRRSAACPGPCTAVRNESVLVCPIFARTLS